MKKILFIANLSHNKKSLIELWQNKNQRNITELYGASTMPRGILSIDSYIKRYCKNIKTRILDLNAAFIGKIWHEDMEQVLEFSADHLQEFLRGEIAVPLAEFQPDIIAISSLFDKNISALLLLQRKSSRCCNLHISSQASNR